MSSFLGQKVPSDPTLSPLPSQPALGVIFVLLWKNGEITKNLWQELKSLETY